jgi:hypothetical protein
MTEPLQETLVERAGGNLRVLTNMATELLEEAMTRNMSQLDEKLYLDVFAQHGSRRSGTDGPERRKR